MNCQDVQKNIVATLEWVTHVLESDRALGDNQACCCAELGLDSVYATDEACRGDIETCGEPALFGVEPFGCVNREMASL
jgi:hypothetical protein